MPRRAGPWYRKDRSRWYMTTPDGKQLPLPFSDPNDPDGAKAAYTQFVADLAAKLKETVPAQTGPNVSEVVAAFLKRQESRVSTGTLRAYRFALAVHFTATFGNRAVSCLTADEVEAWADRPAWSRSTRNSYLGAVQTMLKWAKVKIDRPIARPPKESRGAESVLTDEQFAEVLKESKVIRKRGDFRELLQVLRETGARPGEVSGLTVEMVDWTNACVRLKEHKGARHTAERPIHFSAAAMVILEGQRTRYGEGLLFRSCNGRRFSPKVIVQRCGQISKRVGFRVIAYGLGRHSFATKALCVGVPDAVVAALLGHKSTAMIHAHYGHVSQQGRVLKDALGKMAG